MKKGSASAWKKPGMVDWYSPGQLVQTGASTLMSGLLGASLDNRRIIAFGGSRADSVIDYSDRQGLSFDYIADTGDGWDSTYSMAYLLTSPSLSVEGEAQPLARADLVVVGGDAVYPVASKEAYAKRLVWPFNEAERSLGEVPYGDIRWHMYLIPGNHDWYDSLGSMSRRFFAARSEGTLRRRRVGQFLTSQVRSYFVLKLPRDWQIWAVDIQLGADIDPEQFAFFQEHAASIGPDTKIVLCTAQPTIVYAASEEHGDDSLIFSLKRIRRLAARKGAKVRVQLAGDIHNYQHYVATETGDGDGGGASYERHHVVCGGGGAFLHPTHGFNKGSADDPRIEPLARYPDRRTSRRLAWGNLAFAFRHKGMSALLGVVYALLFWSDGLPDDPASYVIQHPGSALLMLVLVAGLAVFPGKGHTLWGLLHGVSHVALATGCWWLAGRLGELVPWMSGDIQTRLAVFLLGAVLGGTLFGLYLLASLNLVRIHHNEGFSSLACADHKSFLRCTIEDDGSLTIRVIGVPRTASADQPHPVRTQLVETIRVS